jgi:probable phosphoglycerate mutase
MTEAIALFRRPFYFVRHGETETNLQRLVAGSIDTPLTARGRQQALDAAQLLAKEPVTAVYSSPLCRARDTAAPIAERLRLSVVVLPGLAERAWGALEGQPRASRVRDVTPQGAETPIAFSERILGALAQIDSDAPLIVGHSGVFRVLCHTLGIADSEAPIANALPLRFEPSSPTTWKLKELI